MTHETAAKPAKDAPSRREMPVLFHLMDVRPRSAGSKKSSATASKPATQTISNTPVTPPPAALIAAPPATELAAELPVSKPAVVEAPKVEVTPKVEAKPEVTPPAETQVPPPAVAAASVVKPQPKSLPSEPVLQESVAEKPAASAVEAMVDKATAETQPASDATVTPASSRRKRGESREPQETAKPTADSWFTTHGRNIALVFIVALAATIYFARSGDSKKPTPNADWPAAHPGDAASIGPPSIEMPSESPVETSSAPELVSEPPAPPSTASVYSDQGSSPASGIELGTPEAAPAAPNDDRALFPWNQTAQGNSAPPAGGPSQPAAEMASRPQVETATSTPPAAAPAAPAISYPSTGRGGNYAPPLAPPANAPVAPAPGAAGGVAPGMTYGTVTPNYEPRLGNRYERSGSGLY